MRIFPALKTEQSLDANINYRHRDLVENCRKGDRRSQYDLYTLYIDAMFNTGMRMLRNKEDAEDVVHGVYLGFMTSYGQTGESDTYIGSLKMAYVANQTFEVGFEAVGLYVDRYYTDPAMPSIDVYAGYGGLHLEPILFGRQKVNLAFPILIGGGGVFYDDDHPWIPGNYYDNWDYLFVAEPGANIQYNISRYLQVEAGVKYRFTSRIDLGPYPLSRLEGFSAGIGIKFGIFNLGKNRYKKNL